MDRSFSTLLAVSQAPVIVLFGYVYLKDKHDREPLELLVKTFFAGALSSLFVIVVELLFRTLPEVLPLGRVGHIFVGTIVGVALVEECGKYLALRRIAYHRAEFNEPYDGIMYAVASALGFAAIENLLYVFGQGFEVGVLRMFTAVPMHAVCGVIMGFYVGLAKFSTDKNRAALQHLVGVGLAVLTHGTYNYFIVMQITFLTPLAFLVLGVQILLALRAIGMYRHKIPLHSTDGFSRSLPAFDSLVPDKLHWAVSSLRVFGLLLIFWPLCTIIFLPGVGPLVEHLSILPVTLKELLLLAAGLSFLLCARRLQQRRKWAWRLAFACFVLTLPTPAFILGLAGLYGLLHQDFNGLTPNVSS